LKYLLYLPAWYFGVVGTAATRASRARNTMLNCMVMLCMLIVRRPGLLY